MTKTVRYCDFCGAENALQHTFFVERKMDAAGSMENEYDSVDLCHKHAIALLSDYDKQAPRTPILAIIEQAKHRGKK